MLSKFLRYVVEKTVFMDRHSKNFLKLSRRLFEAPDQRQAFEDCLAAGTAGSPALLWLRDRPANLPFGVLPGLSWQPEFVDRIESSSGAGSHPFHEQGDYYCLDFSSVFEASVLTAIPEPPKLIADMCASPGGKAIFSYRMFSPQTLLANETIRKRTAALISNFTRCNIAGAVTSLDSGFFTKYCPPVFDLLIADAPCSGQSLIARGKEAPGCFHPATINLNSNRQKRILANSAAVVRGGGHLAYMTCTYSIEENEKVLEWFLQRFPHFSACEVPDLTAQRSLLSDVPCYRLWPQSGIGAGGFAALLRRQDETPAEDFNFSMLPVVWHRSGIDRARQ
jgi:16S rRNA C967 or C1407 C5-methylase (RsmB/RsmF family)